MNATWRRLRLEPLAWIALASFIGYRIWPQVGAAFGIDSANVAAPAFRLTTLDGQPLSNDALLGRVVLVNFWATWCAPCREEMPEFIKAQKDFGAQGLQIVGIAIDSADKVRPFATEIGLNYPTLIGGFGAMELSRTLGNGVMALPFTVVLDRKGGIAHTQLGILKPERLASLMRQLL